MAKPFFFYEDPAFSYEGYPETVSNGIIPPLPADYLVAASPTFRTFRLRLGRWHFICMFIRHA